MKSSSILFSILFFLSVISGWLLSKATLIGRTGINLFYKEYQFLKVWWQGALVVLVVLLGLWMLHQLVRSRFNRNRAILAHSLMLFIYLVGLYFTYQDFRNDLSHRLLGERFHLGAYLFWLGAIMIAIFYLSKNNSYKPSPISRIDNKNDKDPEYGNVHA